MMVDAAGEVRRDTLLRVRRYLDRWGQQVLGGVVYDVEAWPQILMRRAHNEITYARRCMERPPGRFLVTKQAETALHLAHTLPVVAPPMPATLWGVPVDVGPRVDGFDTPGRAWTRRHVSAGYVEVCGEHGVHAQLTEELDDWCRSCGLARVEPVRFEWRQVTVVEHKLGVVFEVTARADTERLTAPFLG